MISLKVFQEAEHIESLRLRWEALLKERVTDTPVFLTPEWISHWLKFLGKKHKPYILTLWEADNLIGICPFAIKRLGLPILGLSKLEFIGRREADYLDLIIKPSKRQEAIECVISHLKETKNGWDICELIEIREDSKNLEGILSTLSKTKLRHKSHGMYKSSFLKIVGRWEDYYRKTHGRKFRYNIQRSRRQLEGKGRLHYKRLETISELKYYLPEIFRVHQQRWKGFFIASKFSQPEGKQFYAEIAQQYLERGWLKLDLLLLDEKVIAFSYSFCWDGRLLFYTPAYDPRYSRYSPGTVLLLSILEDAFKSGTSEFDFSKGELYYKSHWATDERENKRVIFASPTLRGRIALRFYLCYLTLYFHIRRPRLLRLILGKARQMRDYFRDKTTYIPPQVVISPGELFKTNRSKSKLVEYSSQSPLFLRDGRSALLYGLRVCGIPQGEVVLVPAYLCESVVTAVKAADLRVRFYKVKGNLEPDFHDLALKSKDARALLIVHYFGFPQPLQEITRFCREKGLLLLEDCAHSLFGRLGERPLGTFGAFGFFSLHKTLPVPHGGMLLLKNGNEGERRCKKRTYSIMSTLSLLEKWAEFKMGFSLRCYLLQIDSLRNAFIKRDTKSTIDPGQGISHITLRVMQGIEEKAMVEKRRANYRYYLERLGSRKGIEILFPDIPEGVCPLGFLILVEDRDRIRKELLGKRINSRTLWDILPEEVCLEEHRVAADISKRILVLPVHQSLEERHLEYTVNNFLSVI